MFNQTTVRCFSNADVLPLHFVLLNIAKTEITTATKNRKNISWEAI